MNIDKRVSRAAHRILEVAEAMAEHKRKATGKWDHVDEIRLHCHGYADRGHTDPACGLIATGNWNGEISRRVGDAFEKLGIEIEWSDQWSECDQCYRLIRTDPDSYHWQPNYVIGDGSITCADCIDPVDYLRDLEVRNETRPAIGQIRAIDPTDHGYVKMNAHAYESGWHPGQTDDPLEVLRDLQARGYKRILFYQDEQSQFYTRWSVYVHEVTPACVGCKATGADMLDSAAPTDCDCSEVT